MIMAIKSLVVFGKLVCLFFGTDQRNEKVQKMIYFYQESIHLLSLHLTIEDLC